MKTEGAATVNGSRPGCRSHRAPRRVLCHREDGEYGSTHRVFPREGCSGAAHRMRRNRSVPNTDPPGESGTPVPHGRWLVIEPAPSPDAHLGGEYRTIWKKGIGNWIRVPASG